MLAILAQNGNRIGLFEHLRIHQNRGELNWFRPVRSPLADWIAPRARLAEEMYSQGPRSSQVEILGSTNLILDRNGNVQEQTQVGSFSRLPYIVRFWEEGEFFPVFTLFPDNNLLWNRTIVSSIVMPWRWLPNIPARHFRLQNDPIPRQRQPRRELEIGSRCAITLEPLTSDAAFWLPCGHAFSDAIFHAATTDARCPLCRSPFEQNEIES